jgi:hypothetical protein
MIATFLGYAFLAIIIGGFVLCVVAAFLDGGEFIRTRRSGAHFPEVR